jgi:tRNA threonylcarbamoyladenosine biosynthesis protein TsaB
MITLAIDTSTPRGAVALSREDKPLAEEAFDRSQAGQNLFDTAAKLLSENHLTVSDIGLLAVGLGPGSFTGIRAGIAAAKGLALPRKLPIKGAGS